MESPTAPSDFRAELIEVEYAAAHIGDESDGFVAGVTKVSAIVRMTERPVVGRIHLREMDGDWVYNERRNTLVSRSSGQRIQVGDTCRVRIVAADLETRRIDLVFVEMPGQIDP